MEKLTIYQLRLLEQQIDGIRGYKPKWIARGCGFSNSLIYQARYLINCQPVGWQECLQGRRTISEVYRSRKTDREIWKM